MERVILHIDQNNFYASVERLYNPALRDKPVAVGGDVEQRHRNYRQCASVRGRSIGGISGTKPELLERWLGKNGVMLWRFANGLDYAPVATIESKLPIKSIGNSTTTPRDLVTDEDVKVTMTVLCESVAARLREQGMNCSTVQISIRDSELSSYERQAKLDFPTCVCSVIQEKAFALYKAHHRGQPIRSIGVRACDLSGADMRQLSLLPEEIKAQKLNDLECTMDTIRRRFGNFAVRRGNTLVDTKLSSLDPKKDHTIHPVAFLNGG